MHFGQFFTSTARTEHRCLNADCITEIIPGDDYVGLIIRRKNSKPFMQAYHRPCFFEGIDQQLEHRQGLIKERRAAPRPYRVIRLSPELTARKKTLVHRLSVVKGQLLMSYIKVNPKRIQHNKETLVKILRELNQPEFEKPYWWRFGEDFIKILEGNVDPLITADDARRADKEDSREAIRLLTLESALASPVDYELNSDLEVLRKKLAEALSGRDKEKKRLLALAAALELSPTPFVFGKELEKWIPFRNDLFADEGSRPSTFNELLKAQDSNKALAQYFRVIAGRVKEKDGE